MYGYLSVRILQSWSNKTYYNTCIRCTYACTFYTGENIPQMRVIHPIFFYKNTHTVADIKVAFDHLFYIERIVNFNWRATSLSGPCFQNIPELYFYQYTKYICEYSICNEDEMMASRIHHMPYYTTCILYCIRGLILSSLYCRRPVKLTKD